MLAKKEFEDASPRQKGYLVYLCGARDDEPNVPESFSPQPDERAEYEEGQMEAIVEVQDDA